MAKKVKRQVSSSTTAVVNTTTAAPSLIRPSSEFNPDYTPIVRDLKRIGILAAGFLVVLVALSFILN